MELLNKPRARKARANLCLRDAGRPVGRALFVDPWGAVAVVVAPVVGDGDDLVDGTCIVESSTRSRFIRALTSEAFGRWEGRVRAQLSSASAVWNRGPGEGFFWDACDARQTTAVWNLGPCRWLKWSNLGAEILSRVIFSVDALFRITLTLVLSACSHARLHNHSQTRCSNMHIRAEDAKDKAPIDGSVCLFTRECADLWAGDVLVLPNHSDLLTLRYLSARKERREAGTQVSTQCEACRCSRNAC